MSPRKSLALVACVALASAGCANKPDPWICAFIGAATVGGGAGAAGAQDDHDDRGWALGAVGAIVGGYVGYQLCKPEAVVEAPAPPPRAEPPPEPAPEPARRRIVLRGVNFAFDRADITPESEGILDVAVETLKQNAEVNIEVAGHTDWTGTDEYNQGLSERRARAVRDYLVSHGVGADRLTVRGYGESRPVADNNTRDGRAQNRRTELNQLE
jgi:OOP family OmpA-OmpF porin